MLIMIYPFIDFPNYDIEHPAMNFEKLAINILADYNLEGVSLNLLIKWLLTLN